MERRAPFALANILAFSLSLVLTLASCGASTIVPAGPTPTAATPTSAGAPTATRPTSSPTAGGATSTPASTLPAAGNTSTPAPSATISPTPSPQANSSGIPAFSHIYVIVMENKEYGSVIGSREAPYINSLATQYALATNYTAVAHPSEPNYLALFSGSTQGVTDDGLYNLSGQNLADEIEAAGKTWKVYAENVPTTCFAGIVAEGGPDGPGTYARKHNPAISFNDISRSPARCANITDLTHFDPVAADYALIVPNLCHDMHDCSVATGDEFLKGFVPKISNSSAWQEEGVVFLVWDEGFSGLGGGGHVPLLVISKQVPPNLRATSAYNHYSLLRTIQDAWGLPCLNLTCAANNFARFFGQK